MVESTTDGQLDKVAGRSKLEKRYILNEKKGEKEKEKE